MDKLKEEPIENYKLEINGLRALAIIAIIIFHFNNNNLPSGFLGVDIFFVITGYVITSSLSNKNYKNIKDYLIDFYIKRIKKLFPALIFYILITSLLISFVNQNPIDELRTGMASLMGLTNIFLAYTSGDYFQVSTKLNPFLHIWYLSLVTQFYIIFPLIFLLTGFARKRKKWF